jgi:hypothetical protein
MVSSTAALLPNAERPRSHAAKIDCSRNVYRGRRCGALATAPRAKFSWAAPSACAQRFDPLSDLLVPRKGISNKRAAVWLGGGQDRFPPPLTTSKSETSEHQHRCPSGGSGHPTYSAGGRQGVREPKSFIATHVSSNRSSTSVAPFEKWPRLRASAVTLCGGKIIEKTD